MTFATITRSLSETVWFNLIDYRETTENSFGPFVDWSEVCCWLKSKELHYRPPDLTNALRLSRHLKILSWCPIVYVGRTKIRPTSTLGQFLESKNLRVFTRPIFNNKELQVLVTLEKQNNLKKGGGCRENKKVLPLEDTTVTQGPYKTSALS